MIVRQPPRRILLEVIVAASLIERCQSDTWFTQSNDVRLTSSVRVRANSALGTVQYGGGDADDPASLRGVAYTYESQKPYEWFLKFNLDSFANAHVDQAELIVSKCRASPTCTAACKVAGKCTCATFFAVVDASCGGGSIDETYSTDSDDLHVWHVPNVWDEQWKYEDWSHTWTGLNGRTGVESCCSQGTGGSSHFSYANYVTGTDVVGESGTARLNVLSAIGTHDSDSRYIVRGGYVSFRLTVNGTNSRFFVPESGDASYTPYLRLRVTYTTTATGTTTTATSTTSTSTTSTTTTTTVTTIAGATTTTSTTETTTTTTTTTSTTTNTDPTTTYTGTTTTSTTTTSTTTTTSGPSTTTTSSSTTNNTDDGSGSGTTMTTTIAMVATNGNDVHNASIVAAGIDVIQVFTLTVIEPADVAVALNRQSFQATCLAAAVAVLNRSADDIKLTSLVLTEGRRLATVAAGEHSSPVTFRYHISTSSSAEMVNTIARLGDAEYADSFCQQLKAAENNLLDGLRISSCSLVSLSSPGFQLAMEGGTIDVFGCLGWMKTPAAIQTWAAQAETSMVAALKKELVSILAPKVEADEIKISGRSLTVSASSSQVTVPFALIAQVPATNASDDPDGSIFQARVNQFSSKFKNLTTSDVFDALFRAELNSHGVVEMPSLSFYPGACTTSATGYGGAAASGGAIAAILGVFCLVGLVFYCFVYRRKVRRRLSALISFTSSGQKQAETHYGPTIISASDVEEMVMMDDEMIAKAGHVEEGQSCSCGNHILRDAQFCRKCGKAVEARDRAREAYVRSKTNQTLTGALDEFDEPTQKPGSPTGLGGNFFGMLGAGANALADMAEDLAYTGRKSLKARRPSEVSDGNETANHPRNHKYYGESAHDAQLDIDARNLRQAMGGRHAGGNDIRGTPDSTILDPSQASTAVPQDEATSSRLPVTPAGGQAGSRPLSPGGDSSTSEEEMEIVEVTDDSSDGEDLERK